MTEVKLAKRFFALTLFALIALSIVACTRDKPADTPVPGTAIAQRTVVTPPPTAVGTVSAADATQTVTATVTLTSTVPTTPTLVLPPTPGSLPPMITPVPTAAPAAGGSSTPDTYVVQWGDWLNKIAQQLGVTPQALIAANPGINPNLLTPGQKLNVPGAASSLTPVVPGVPIPTTPATLPNPQPNPSTYTVQRGEWIYSIARKFGVTVPALLAANPGIHPNFLYPGQVLNIPSGTNPNPPTPSGNTYTVQPGDTLYTIAVRFKTTIIALQMQNNLSNPNFISPGMVLTIPQ